MLSASTQVFQASFLNPKQQDTLVQANSTTGLSKMQQGFPIALSIHLSVLHKFVVQLHCHWCCFLFHPHWPHCIIKLKIRSHVRLGKAKEHEPCQCSSYREEKIQHGNIPIWSHPQPLSTMKGMNCHTHLQWSSNSTSTVYWGGKRRIQCRCLKNSEIPQTQKKEKMSSLGAASLYCGSRILFIFEKESCQSVRTIRKQVKA